MSSALVGFADEPLDNKDHDDDRRRVLLIDDLDSTLVGTDVTVRFAVAGLQGVAQRLEPGQSPTFILETAPGIRTENRLSVWIKGELTNVLHHLQMGFLQENQLKEGTTILATGHLGVHTMDANLFLLDVSKWQDFRIVPSDAGGPEE